MRRKLYSTLCRSKSLLSKSSSLGPTGSLVQASLISSVFFPYSVKAVPKLAMKQAEACFNKLTGKQTFCSPFEEERFMFSLPLPSPLFWTCLDSVTDSLVLPVYFRCCVTVMERASAATVFVTRPQCTEGNTAMSVRWVFFKCVVGSSLGLYARPVIYEQGYHRSRHGEQKEILPGQGKVREVYFDPGENFENNTADWLIFRSGKHFRWLWSQHCFSLMN